MARPRCVVFRKMRLALSMDRKTVMRMTGADLERHCASHPVRRDEVVHRRCMDLTEAWPLWEAACRVRPTWMLRANNEGVLILARRPGGDLIVVPSGAPAEAIRRA